jgi:hypothetical protein
MRMTHEMGDANAKLNLWHLVAVSKFCQAVLPIAMRERYVRRGKRGVLFTTTLAGDDASAAAAGAAGPGRRPAAAHAATLQLQLQRNQLQAVNDRRSSQFSGTRERT